MTCKGKSILIIISFILSFNILSIKNYTSAKEKNILITYDSYKAYGEKLNLLNEVIKSSLNLESSLEVINLEEIENINFNSYDEIILLKNKPEEFKENIINILASYSNKILLIINSDEEKENLFYKEISEVIRIKSLEDYDKNKTVREAILRMSKNNNKIFFMLDEAYPFDDLNELLKKIDYLYNKGIPFIISSMPIFNNQNSEAMKRYMEVLRYAESRGGSIILHYPYIYQKDNVSADIKEISSKMAMSQKSFQDYLVYATAIDISEDWLYFSDINKYLDTSNTLFITPIDEDIKISKYNIKINKKENVIEKVPYNNFNNKDNYLNNIAITLRSDTDFEVFKNNLNTIKENKIYFNDFMNMNSYVHMREDIIKKENGNIFLNNINVNSQKFISIKDFENMFIREVEDTTNNEEIDLSYANRWIILLTTIASFIFLIIGIRSRNLDRNKFFK